MNQYLLLIKYKKLNNKNMFLQKTLSSLIYAENIRENPVEGESQSTKWNLAVYKR